MQCRFARIAVAVAALTGMAACGGGGNEAPNLMNIRSSTNTPDEFGIMPTKPIEMPADMSQLPPPTPGASNRTDIDPRADAIVALGGRPERATPQGQIPGSDAGLVNYSSRFGREAGVREQLASEDLEFRQNNRGKPLERWAGLNVYFDAYEDQSLDQHQELQRVRGGGARNVSAPPDFSDN
ncbi:DUF3035 domain-containing protein [Tropicimonas sp. S265A]|uniref:DUF3035 domain-containing protein n=1 Tax=Tropicimonas sp. S265A TaxID=3415134 RepID=UPI003C7BCF59